MYPTIEEVNSAGHVQICTWYRFLNSPGHSAIGFDNFEEVLKQEKVIMDRIFERYKEFGGMTPQVSKLIGWQI